MLSLEKLPGDVCNGVKWLSLEIPEGGKVSLYESIDAGR